MFDLTGMCIDDRIETKPLTAVYAHPLHGRLVNQVMMVVCRYKFIHDCWYEMSWRDGDDVYYVRTVE